MVLTLKFVTGQGKNGEDILEEKIFVVNRIDGIFLRKALEIKQQLANSDVTPEILDGFLEFVCEVYRNKFVIDDIYRGVEACKLMEVVTKTIEGLMGDVGEKLDTFPFVK